MAIPKLFSLLPEVLRNLTEEDLSKPTTPSTTSSTTTTSSTSDDHDEEHSRAEDEFHRNPGLYGPDQ